MGTKRRSQASRQSHQVERYCGGGLESSCMARTSQKTPGTKPLKLKGIAGGHITFEPVTGLHIILLQKINSPLLVMDKVVGLPIESVFQALFLLSHPAETTRHLLLRGPSPAFESAVLDFAATVPAGQVPVLAVLLNEHLSAAFGKEPSKKVGSTTPPTTRENAAKTSRR